ncbi:MAG: phospholipase D-like domain-containing protein [Planctomycetota bacterium]
MASRCPSLLVLLSAALCGLASAQTPEVRIAPFEDAEGRALALLRTAQVSVDVAQYNIRNEDFLVALRELRDRGVAVRIVVDAKNAANPWNTLDDQIEAEGFAIKRYENTASAYAIMHHKFTVIDGLHVMTGSFNWNETAQLVNDENMIDFADAGLAAAYEQEFAELWGDAPADQPGVGQGALGTVHFSPEDHPGNAIVATIRAAQRRVLVAMFTFTDRNVSRALADAAKRGVEVVLLVEKKQADNTPADEAVATGGGRVIVGANVSSPFSAMHQKFAVIDDETVITGACNWTYTAFNQSNEDVLILRDPALARRYTDGFAALVERYDAANYRPADFAVARAEASLHFLVRCSYTGLGDRVVVVGDHPALGAWDLQAGVELRTSDGVWPSWSGRVALPAGTTVHYKAVVLRADGSVSWETGADREVTLDAAGTDEMVDVSFRPAKVQLQFTADAPASGELRLVGSLAEVGAWDPAAGLAFQPDGQGRLALTVELAADAALSCKLVTIAPDGTVTWEDGDDRAVWTGEQDATVDLPPR